MSPNPTKKNTVFILGAGASKLAGVPLMAEFLDVARDIHRTNAHPEFKADYQAVIEGISAFQGVYAKSFLDLENIEAVFAAFEMAKLLGRISDDFPPEKITRLPYHMRRLIGSVVEQTTIFGWGALPIPSPQPYDRFVDTLRSLQRYGHQSSILTFNYDVGLDCALAKYSYLQQEKPQEYKPFDGKVLKLHGSLHWFKCKNDKCDYLVKIDLLNLLRNVDDYWKPISESKSRLELLNDPHISKMVCDVCQSSVESDPFIVPPTWSKMQHYQSIVSVWQEAAKTLAEAENIIVCGYSLPQTDEFFRYLFALGTYSTTHLRRFWVINPDNTVADRFRPLLGAGAAMRFKYWPETFEASIARIHNELSADK